ncbi:DEAD-box ATP-dependent RNA helicase 7 [Zea mays]|uniref:RNA helicase n=3 Tax=Zea mays TaxID=4577 RepID=A0A1D6Q1N7_MAIZE|nr:DEAD-box ATP-dependent RNA helicase 7 [Zea mays]
MLWDILNSTYAFKAILKSHFKLLQKGSGCCSRIADCLCCMCCIRNNTVYDMFLCLSVEVAWRLPSFYTHHFCGIRDGQLSIPVTKRAESRSASTQGLGNAVSPSWNPSEIVGKKIKQVLGKVEDATKVQTLLFSATLPDWVNKLSMRFLKVDRKTVDLVGNEKLKASASVKHLALPCNKAARAQVIPDIIRCNTGVAVMLYEPRYKHSVSRLEWESGVKFEHISVPQPTDVAQSAGSEAADAIASVSDSVIPIFRQQAEQLLSSSSLSAADLLAKALAKAVGYTDLKKRSLLSSLEDYSTLHLQTGRPMWSPGFAITFR